MNNFLVPTTIFNVQAFMGLIDYHRNYVKGYSHITTLLFELIKKYNTFNWNTNCQNDFNLVTTTLTLALILVRPNFTKAFFFT
jgi:hypothetical protein